MQEQSVPLQDALSGPLETVGRRLGRGAVSVPSNRVWWLILCVSLAGPWAEWTADPISF